MSPLTLEEQMAAAEQAVAEACKVYKEREAFLVAAAEAYKTALEAWEALEKNTQDSGSLGQSSKDSLCYTPSLSVDDKSQSTQTMPNLSIEKLPQQIYATPDPELKTLEPLSNPEPICDKINFGETDIDLITKQFEDIKIKFSVMGICYDTQNALFNTNNSFVKAKLGGIYKYGQRLGLTEIELVHNNRDDPDVDHKGYCTIIGTCSDCASKVYEEFLAIKLIQVNQKYFW